MWVMFVASDTTACLESVVDGDMEAKACCE